MIPAGAVMGVGVAAPGGPPDMLSNAEKKQLNDVLESTDFKAVVTELLTGDPTAVTYAHIINKRVLRQVFTGETSTKVWYAIGRQLLDNFGFVEGHFKGNAVDSMKMSPTIFIKAAYVWRTFSREEAFKVIKNPPKNTNDHLAPYCIVGRVAWLLVVRDFLGHLHALPAGAKVGALLDPVRDAYPTKDTGHGWSSNPANPFYPSRNMEKDGALVPGQGFYEALRKVEDSFSNAAADKRFLSLLWDPEIDGAIGGPSTPLRSMHDGLLSWQKTRESCEGVVAPALDKTVVASK